MSIVFDNVVNISEDVTNLEARTHMEIFNPYAVTDIQNCEIYLNIRKIATVFKTEDLIIQKLIYSSVHELIHAFLDVWDENIAHNISIALTETNNDKIASNRLYLREYAPYQQIEKQTINLEWFRMQDKDLKLFKLNKTFQCKYKGTCDLNCKTCLHNPINLNHYLGEE